MFINFLTTLKLNPEPQELEEYYEETLEGNYVGTKIILFSQPDKLFDLSWTNEEIEIMRNSKNKPTKNKIKEVTFNLYKKDD